MTGPVRLERHLLASNADEYDQAWRTFGVSPGLEGDTSRLESAVPWGVRTAEAADPARLDGDPVALADPANYDRLDTAFFRLPFGDEPRPWAYSIWGAVGAPVGRLNRVATHTVVIPRRAFSWIAGHPGALLAARGGPAPILTQIGDVLERSGRSQLEPVTLDGPGSWRGFERERLRELTRLRDRLLDFLDGDRARLARRLGALYESLAVVVAGEAEQVALRGDDTAGPRVLARLAWLSLPIGDRERVSWTTDLAQVGSGGWTLAVVHDRGPVPRGTLVMEPDTFESPRPVAEGRRHWSKLVALFSGSAVEAELVDSYPRLSARLDARSGSLIAGSAVETELGLSAWRESGDGGIDGALRLAELEARRGPGDGVPRYRAAGRAVAEAIAGTEPDRADALLDRIRSVAPDGWAADRAHAGRAPSDRAPSGRLVGGTLRRLRSLDPALAGRLRLAAVARGLVHPSSLGLLAGPERRSLDALLADPAGPELLLRELAAAAAAGWSDPGDFTRVVVRRLARPEPVIRDAQGRLALRDPVEARWACVLLEALEARWPERFPDPTLLDAWLAPVLEGPGDQEAAEHLRRWLARPSVATAYAAGASARASAGSSASASAGAVSGAVAGPSAAYEGYVRRVRVPLSTLADVTATAPGSLGDALAGLCASDRGEDALELMRRAVDGPFTDDARRALAASAARLPAGWIGRPEVLMLLLMEAETLGDRVVDALLLEFLSGSAPIRQDQAELTLRHMWRRKDLGAGLLEKLRDAAPPARTTRVLLRLMDAPPPPRLYLVVRASLRRVTSGQTPWLRSDEDEDVRRVAPALASRSPSRRLYLLARDHARTRRG